MTAFFSWFFFTIIICQFFGYVYDLSWKQIFNSVGPIISTISFILSVLISVFTHETLNELNRNNF